MKSLKYMIVAVLSVWETFILFFITGPTICSYKDVQEFLLQMLTTYCFKSNHADEYVLLTSFMWWI